MNIENNEKVDNTYLKVVALVQEHTDIIMSKLDRLFNKKFVIRQFSPQEGFDLIKNGNSFNYISYKYTRPWYSPARLFLKLKNKFRKQVKTYTQPTYYDLSDVLNGTKTGHIGE